MSHLTQYFKERENFDSIENEYGFASYIIIGNECYLKDIFIEKQFRQLNLATKLADEVTKIALMNGCTILTGSVCPTANNSTASLHVLINYGMKLHSCKENLIIFKKDLV